MARQKRTTKPPKAPPVQPHWFVVAFQRSLVIQGAVTLVLIGTISRLYMLGQAVPDGLLTLAGVVLGYWFKSKDLTAG